MMDQKHQAKRSQTRPLSPFCFSLYVYTHTQVSSESSERKNDGSFASGATVDLLHQRAATQKKFLSFKSGNRENKTKTHTELEKVLGLCEFLESPTTLLIRILSLLVVSYAVVYSSLWGLVCVGHTESYMSFGLA